VAVRAAHDAVAAREDLRGIEMAEGGREGGEAPGALRGVARGAGGEPAGGAGDVLDVTFSEGGAQTAVTKARPGK